MPTLFKVLRAEPWLQCKDAKPFRGSSCADMSWSELCRQSQEDSERAFWLWFWFLLRRMGWGCFRSQAKHDST